MRRKRQTRDSIAAHQREAVAARRFGENAQCACGESRPEVLLAGSRPTICAACDRKRRGKTPIDKHHVAGKSNSAITIPVAVNDHRAWLSADQYDWPKQTLENPTGNPLLIASASLRGYADTTRYLVEALLHPEMLEELNAFLTEKLGVKWWIGTPLEKYAKRR